jgi:hypothetical protein
MSQIERAGSQQSIKENGAPPIWGEGILAETTVDIDHDIVRDLEVGRLYSHVGKAEWEKNRNAKSDFFSVIEASGKGRMHGQSYERHG